MIVYHGSNIIVQKPEIRIADRLLDFGYGFYTTENKEQAISFAEKVYRRRKDGVPTVSIYEFDDNIAYNICSLLKFNSPNEAWLDFVYQQRTGTYDGKIYDLIYGPVANDDVYATFNLFETGILSKEDTLKHLKIKKLYNQLIFTSEQALSFLRLTGVLKEGL